MYTVKITVGADASKYWGSAVFEGKDGTTHERHTEKEREASANSNVIQALIDIVKILNRPCMLDVYTESDYLVQPFAQGWIKNWEKHDWKNAKGNTVRNAEQWKELREALAPHSARFMKLEEK